MEHLVAVAAKGLGPLALHRLRNAASRHGVVETHANQVTLMARIIDKPIAAVEDRRVVDHVDVARQRRKLHFRGSRDGLDDVERLPLHLRDDGQAGIARVGGGAQESGPAKVDKEFALLEEDDWAARKSGKRKRPVAGSQDADQIRPSGREHIVNGAS